ncbi:MAG: CotH kinase family protein [Phycisphaerae bacterium]|nr:CotH kinase family protein [Phycisphaerae bacterium]
MPTVPTAIEERDALFSSGPNNLRFELEPADFERLKGDARAYVRVTMREVHRDGAMEEPMVVAMKLKGAAGSYREINDKPALTIKVDRFERDARFHGLAKFHLNNSVQNESHLHESLASELFAAAGIATQRATHGRVWLNGRDLGLYVLKESFDACRESDPVERLVRVERLIDLDAFRSFTTMERLIGHWDGYTDGSNNYRIYTRPDREGRGISAVFLPQGMDQVRAMILIPHSSTSAKPVRSRSATGHRRAKLRRNSRRKRCARGHSRVSHHAARTMVPLRRGGAMSSSPPAATSCARWS